MNKCIVIIAEGETEVEFYKKMISYFRNKNSIVRFNSCIEYLNVNGIGGFKNNALRKFIKEVVPKYGKNCEYIVFLCSDTDVFEFSIRPPINWEVVISEFKKNGANEVFQIEADKSIEDWFLIDLEGIIKYLRLKKNTKPTGKNGYEKLKSLFKLANRMYYKGAKCEGLIDHLDIGKIYEKKLNKLKPLFEKLTKKELQSIC